MNFRVQLTTTSCNLGGVRYWFICPLVKNGVPCNRRVGCLYSLGKWFGCRHCGEFTYQARLEDKFSRIISVTQVDVEEARQEARTKYYKGKLTRKYKRYLRLKEKANSYYGRAVLGLSKNFKA